MTSTSIETLLDATRLTGLETTEGGRIVARVSALDAKGTSYRGALVEIDGERLVPLTRGSASIGAVALAEDGTTFFTAKRVGEDGEETEDAQLWALPPRGEARELASRPGGFGGLAVAGRHRAQQVLVAITSRHHPHRHRHPNHPSPGRHTGGRQPPNLDLQEAWQICRGLSWNESR